MSKFGRMYGKSTAQKFVGKNLKGLPLSVILSGANTHEVKQTEETLDHIVTLRPKPEEEHPQNLCLDAGHTGSKEKVEQRGYTPHIRPPWRGEESVGAQSKLPRPPLSRSDHTLFFNRFHKLLVRFEKKPPITLLSFNLLAL